MTIKKTVIAGVVLLAVLMSTEFVSPGKVGKVTDDTNDVLHWKWHESLGTYRWVHSVTNKPNLDIIELSYTIDGQKIKFEMKVKGTIEDSEKVVYVAYYNTTDAIYWMTYTNGEGVCMGIKNDYSQMTMENVTASGNVINATVDTVGTGQEEGFYGYAAQYTGDPGDESVEWWGDWVPQNFAPDIDDGEDGGNDTEDGDNGVPGFEMMLLFGGIAVALILIKRRKIDV